MRLSFLLNWTSPCVLSVKTTYPEIDRIRQQIKLVNVEMCVTAENLIKASDINESRS